MKSYEVVIIGAGTAGLTARREVEKITDRYLLIDPGPLGTTCARVGCMPSKVLIQVAQDFSRRHVLKNEGIMGGEGLSVSFEQVMNHVRSLRDRFVRSVTSGVPLWENHWVKGKAELIDANHVRVNGEIIHFDRLILATGSRPIIPKEWLPYQNHCITTDEFFEQKTLPKRVAVVGLGVIGMELGQAMSQLGLSVLGLTQNKFLGGLTNPKIQNYVWNKINQEFPIYDEPFSIDGFSDSGALCLSVAGKKYEIDLVLLAAGRESNLNCIGLEKLGLQSIRGRYEIDSTTQQLKGFSHIFVAGDSTGYRPILHEAADEGFIAGYNAVHSLKQFKRKTFLGVTFSDPQLCVIGDSYQKLIDKGSFFVTGEVSFEGQGRSIIKQKEQGILQIYLEAKTGKILGCEMQAPEGEHLAHLLAWSIEQRLTVKDLLAMPFYHPVLEEGLRTALRDGAQKLGPEFTREIQFL